MSLTYRKGTIEDSHSVFKVFTESIMDLSERTNVMAITGGRDPQVLETLWQRRKSLFDFLAADAAQFWVAEENGSVVGYARSIEHDGVMDLTEFFVSPKHQSSGAGRELLARAFQSRTAQYKIIVATTDERALSLYLRSGVYARFPIKYFSRKAEHVDVKTDLVFEPIQTEHHMPELNRIDRTVIGHVRPGIHRWMATDREGFLYRRKSDVVGYGYDGGPFALLSDNDYPAVLAHGENLAAEAGRRFGAETPLINRKAIQYFLERKYEIDPFTVFYMSSEPFGKLENYLCFSPIFFM
jgi:ribosomal protein S18 acetylase RimI-like enzyme